MPVDPALRARREAVVKAHVDAENRHDIKATLATFHHARYDVIAFGQVVDGPEGVSALLAGLFAGFPDFTVRPLATYHADNAVIAEVEMSGTHKGPWAGLEPKGGKRRMKVPVAAIFLFDGDRLTSEKIYFDFAAIRQQLGHA